MERVGILLDKLNEQFAHKADIDSLLHTVQLIILELQQKKNLNIAQTTVSVMDLLDKNSRLQTLEINKNYFIKSNSTKNKELTGWLFDDNQDAHTKNVALTEGLQNVDISKSTIELNDRIGEVSNSINDQLRKPENEVAKGFYDTPIRDLKRAIGVNDRFVFINELFRGDEIMYERSIKTINGFNIFPEAQFWIQRELKLKLGWDENSTAVIQFDQLIKRRFS